MKDRRSEPRLLCADVLQVHWKMPNGHKSRSATALLEDISTSGACLQMEEEVPVGSSIYWKSPNQEFGGRVRYCEYREIGFFVGVEFAPGSKWSQTSFEPQHLLDVNQLLP
jgi:hypothetical protein